VADGPTAADESAAAGAQAGDDATAVLYRVCLAAGGPVDAIALALRASSVQVWVAGRIVADVSRVADERCCLRLAWMPVWAPALPRVWRPARVWLAETLADDLVHAAREAALRRDSRGGIHATAGKTVFPSPFFSLSGIGRTSKA
jgi:hypothetical protein